MRNLLAYVIVLLGVGVFFCSSVKSINVIASADRPHSKPDAKQKFRVPTNDEIDWEVDHLGRVRVLVPAFASNAEVTEEEVNILVKALDDPKNFAAAHVILTRIFYGGAPCVSSVRGGFDIRIHRLTVKLRYARKSSADHKTIEFPDDPRLGSQQVFLAAHWKMVISTYQKAGKGSSRAYRSVNHKPMLTTLWCDGRSFALKNVTNDRITWVGTGWGIHPVLVKVHRNEIALGNTKQVPHLLSLLKDKSRFAAAHIALSCIFGIDSYCSTPISAGYQEHINGLHMIVEYDFKKKNWKTTFPDASRQQAWLQYRWMTFAQFEMKQDEKNRKK